MRSDESLILLSFVDDFYLSIGRNVRCIFEIVAVAFSRYTVGFDLSVDRRRTAFLLSIGLIGHLVKVREKEVEEYCIWKG